MSPPKMGMGSEKANFREEKSNQSPERLKKKKKAGLEKSSLLQEARTWHLSPCC